MYDPRQLQYGTYPPVQQGGQQQVVYTQPPASYLPQGQQLIQQIRPPMNQQVPPPQQIVYDIQARHIGSLEEIKLGEVPMDGSMPLFMLQDGSMIVGKFWDRDAQLKTVRYIKEPDQVATPEPQVPMVQTIIDPDISNRLNHLEQLINHCIEKVEAIPTESNYTVQTYQELPKSMTTSTAAKSSGKKVNNNGQ